MMGVYEIRNTINNKVYGKLSRKPTTLVVGMKANVC